MVAYTEALESALDRLPTDEQRARAMTAIAHSAMLRDQSDATEWADKALALADAHDLVDVRSAAMTEKGSVLLWRPEQADEARDLLEAATHEAESVGDHVLAARALNTLVWHARRWSDPDEVRALIERMREHAEAAGFDSYAITEVAGSLAHLAAVEGDLEGAIEHLDAGRRSHAARSGWSKGRWISVFRAGLSLEAGDLDSAEWFTEVSKPITARTAMGIIGLDFHLACRRGDLAKARGLLADLMVVVDQEGVVGPSQTHDLVAAALDAGFEPDELRPLLARVGHFTNEPFDATHPWRRLLDAQLAEAEGRIEEAVDGYAIAARELGTAREIIAGHRGTAHVGAARTLILLRRLDEARVHAEAAESLLARWGGWRVEQLRAVERRLGLGPEPSGPAALTPREREVIVLLAEGLTNSQLAERLYISPRTAAVHVSNILAKLGMASRTEVAAWAVRTGLTDAPT
jgi:DNA-binding CsgD family transcriptional regulator